MTRDEFIQEVAGRINPLTDKDAGEIYDALRVAERERRERAVAAAIRATAETTAEACAQIVEDIEEECEGEDLSLDSIIDVLCERIRALGTVGA